MNKNKEYIEREAVIKMLENTDWYTINKNGILVLGASDGNTALFKARDMFQLVRKTPAADVEPVRHGYWIEYSGDPNIITCSECDWGEPPVSKTYKRCPMCGAKMDRK
jgi:hypothetical protein